MAVPVSDSIPLTGNARIDGLAQGGSWRFRGGPRTLTYSFTRAIDADADTALNWAPDFRRAVDRAFDAWEAVANVSFVRVGDGGPQHESSADIALALLRRESMSSYGSAIFPDPVLVDEWLRDRGFTRASGARSYPRPEGDIRFAGDHPHFDNLTPGSSGFGIVLHEIGHALGLKHPHDDGASSRPTFGELGIGSLNEPKHTIMHTGRLADNDPTDAHLPATPMPLDILAIQRIYGANRSYRTDDDVYRLRNDTLRTVWDAGGTDTFDASSADGGSPCVIDLHAGEFSGPQSGARRTAIAYNVVIENAIGTDGGDLITGNAAANVLSGRNGDDTLRGGKGNDILNGGSGNDALNGGSGSDTLSGGNGDDTLHGAGGNDTFIWNGADVRFDGGNGTDTLKVAGSGTHVNLTTLPDGKLADLERIDLTGSGRNTLTLDEQAVLDLSSSTDTLRVLGNSGDTVHRGAGWTTGADQVLGGVTYRSYTSGLAALLVDSDITSVV